MSTDADFRQGKLATDERMALDERVALKEWAVLVDAMARGEAIAMVRKGGIREQRAGFSVRHDRFLLYPTFFHEKEQELAPRFRGDLAASHARRPPDGMLRIEYVAAAAAVWRVTELERLRSVQHEHGLTWDAVAARFHYRSNPVVHVVAVRVARLVQPAVVPEARRYGGCVSWVALDAPVSVAGAVRVLGDADFEHRISGLAAVLGQPDSHEAD